MRERRSVFTQVTSGTSGSPYASRPWHHGPRPRESVAPIAFRDVSFSRMAALTIHATAGQREPPAPGRGGGTLESSRNPGAQGSRRWSRRSTRPGFQASVCGSDIHSTPVKAACRRSCSPAGARGRRGGSPRVSDHLRT